MSSFAGYNSYSKSAPNKSLKTDAPQGARVLAAALGGATEMSSSSYNEFLQRLAASATSLVAGPVGEFDARNRAACSIFFIERDTESLRALVPCLRIIESSLGEQHAFMTPGDIQLNFLRGHELVASVVFIYPDFLRWERGGADALLQHGEQLVNWLARHGWQVPGTEI